MILAGRTGEIATIGTIETHVIADVDRGMSLVGRDQADRIPLAFVQKTC